MKILILGSIQRDAKFGQAPAVDGASGMSSEQIQLSWGRALLELGHEVDYVMSRSAKRGQSGRRNFCWRLWVKFCSVFSTLSAQAAFLKDLSSALEGGQYGIVILSGNTEPCSVTELAKLKAIYGFKFWILHGLSPKWCRQTVMPTYEGITDLVVTNGRENGLEFEALGFDRVIPLPYTACDPVIQPVNLFPPEEFQYDVGFVGSLGGALYSKRIKLLKIVAEHFNLAIWCGEPREFVDSVGLGDSYIGSVSRSTCPSVYRKCRIMINMHGLHMPDGGNLSTFEIPGSGGFQLIDAYWAEWFVEKKEVVSYHSSEDLLAKIKYYLEHEDERATIACNAQERVLRDHTFVNRFEQLLEVDSTRAQLD